jgi:hypothetical protein
LAWRQHRTDGAITVGLLALLGVVLVAVNASISSTANQIGLGDCLTQFSSGNCGARVSLFAQSFLSSRLTGSVMALKALPALAGIFLGAPLVAREFERGTHRLAWTQSITRSRWLAGHVIAVLGIVLVAAALVQMGLIWTLAPLLDAGDLTAAPVGRFAPLMFDATAIAPLAYAVFAVTLGVFSGALVRRTVVAMVLTLLVFVGIRVAVAEFARPNYMPPITVSATVDSRTRGTDGLVIPTGSWLINVSYNQGGGHFGNTPTCVPPAPGCFDRYTASYQPGDRFWRFQLIESGIYLGLTVLLLSATWLLVQRRTA